MVGRRYLCRPPECQDYILTAENWVSGHLPHRSRIIVDNSVWTDLVRRGFNPNLGVIWMYKLDYATNLGPSVRRALPAGWRDCDYVLVTPVLLAAVSNTPGGLPEIRDALNHSRLVTSFGTRSRPRRNPETSQDGNLIMTDTYLDSSAATTSAVTTPAAADVPAATPAYPEFKSQRRGYDRAQVDEYVTELRRFWPTLKRAPPRRIPGQRNSADSCEQRPPPSKIAWPQLRSRPSMVPAPTKVRSAVPAIVGKNHLAEVAAGRAALLRTFQWHGVTLTYGASSATRMRSSVSWQAWWRRFAPRRLRRSRASSHEDSCSAVPQPSNSASGSSRFAKADHCSPATRLA